VFFYSTRGLELLARRHGYHYFGAGALHVFARSSLAPLRRALLRGVLSRRGIRLLRIWRAARQDNRYAQADYEQLSR
jgi:hypothetical protein